MEWACGRAEAQEASRDLHAEGSAPRNRGSSATSMRWADASGYRQFWGSPKIVYPKFGPAPGLTRAPGSRVTRQSRDLRAFTGPTLRHLGSRG